MNRIVKNYPTCYKSLTKFIGSNESYKNLYMLLNPVLFDTSLRDGLQNIKPNELGKYTTENKIKLYNKITDNHNPDELEIGSVVSEKFFPIFTDSLELFSQLDNKNKNYILVPSFSKLHSVINSGCNNFSFISSVSESFQLANTKKTLETTKNEILEMMFEIVSNPVTLNPKVKIYLSCIDTCPTEGKISNDKIVNEIIYYDKVCKPEIICLSDTCATLQYDNFVNIITNTYKGGVSYEKISLHLHVDVSNPNYYENLQKIFNHSMEVGIRKFDISLFETGGCTMTLGKSNTKPNLSYELYYKLLVDYIVSKV